MKIAIIGSGISGLTAAYLLAGDHEITLFEADSRLGGHTHTHEIEAEGQSWQIDSGFIVFNDRTYPNFIRLLERLKVASQPASMGFSVSNERLELEYSGNGLNGLFAQRSNLFSPRYLGMIKEILHFNRRCLAWLESSDNTTYRLRDFLNDEKFSSMVIENYVMPMTSAIWSATPLMALELPMLFFARFFANHGMFKAKERPQWRVIKGGSSRYIEKMTVQFEDRIRLNTPVRRIMRAEDGVIIHSGHGGALHFDKMILAVHSDQALAMLERPTPIESEVLGAIKYQPNQATLHTDRRLLPTREAAWASWNYRLPKQKSMTPTLTYNMNILQTLKSRDPFLVSLNQSNAIAEDKTLRQMEYAHPVFTPEATSAQARHHEIDGQQHTYYCGAYWFNGFHEDGVRSALRVCEKFGAHL